MISNKNPGIENVTKVVDSRKDNHLSPLSIENATILSDQVQSGDIAAPNAENYYRMTKAIRTSGIWLLIWAGVIAVNQNIPWAIALATVSLMSFYFYDVTAMFLVYTGVMLWAAAWNIFLSVDYEWIGVGIIQIIVALMSIREYRLYRNTKSAYRSGIIHYDASDLTQRENHLAWLALIFGSVILVSIVGFIPAVIAVEYVNSTAFEDLVDIIWITSIEIGILGLPIGVAALVSGSRPKAAAAIGIGLGALSVLVELCLAILGST
jgi:hypothetical protein